MKDKLIEIIRSVQYNDNGSTIGNNFQSRFVERIADHLIENGVTFATDNNVGGKWIPVAERLPEKDGTYIVRTTTGAVTTARFYTEQTYPPTNYRPYPYTRGQKWSNNRNVTHWMPPPEPPKEVEE